MAQYFDNVDLKSNRKEIVIKIKDTSLKMTTDNGVFSKTKLDFGTRLLLESLPLGDFQGKVLDVGCGYGVIGIYLAKNTSCTVDMCDVNRRALHLARTNAKDNQVDVNIFESDAYQNVSDRYQVIITNPPIRAGKEVVYRILLGAKEHLLSDGCLYCVIHKDQGAKSTISELEKSYNVSILEKNKGFFVIKCTSC